MDLLALIGNNDLYTLHSHTQFCDGRAPMEEFAKKAAAQGFRVYGFTPHSPVPIESPCNMSFESVPQYKAEVQRLAAQYPHIKFLTGMEIDYLGPQWGPASDYFRNLGLDFTIGSVHFIPTQEGEMVDIDGKADRFKRNLEEKFHGDLDYVVDTFFAQSQAMVKEDHFDIIGHFDKIKHNAGTIRPDIEETPRYKQLVGDLIDSIIESGVIVEINTKAWTEHHQLFPAQCHWRRLIEAGVPIVVNSDAHFPDRINESRPQALHALHYLQSHSNHQ